MKRVCLILGFFDGIHKGHRNVIKSAVDFARDNNSRAVLITFKNSPVEYFYNQAEYIYPRELSYKIVQESGVNEIIKRDFSELVNISAEEYLKALIKDFSPISISTGFNHTFGYKRAGTSDFLEKMQKIYGYKYFCAPACYFENELVSSTAIKKYLKEGNLYKANNMLSAPYTIESKVIHGNELGRKIGFPTANMIYPEDCVKLPHGVYISETSNGRGVLNWGTKPTVDGVSEVLEVHIPGFSGNLYGKTLRIKILKKIRDEKRFNSIDELKSQIAKDTEECLKL